MLLEFKTKNYKPFVNETSFKMIAAQKQKDLNYSLMLEKIKGKTVKGLCSSVIYGPNAGGKSNVIGAMDSFRAIVMRGNIENTEDRTSPNHAAYNLELIPNNRLKKKEAVEFGVSFIEDSIKIDYELSLDIGKFLQNDYKRKIVKEVLMVNEDIIYARDDKQVTFGEEKAVKKYVKADLKKQLPTMYALASASLNKTELFLTNGFKVLFSQDIYDLIYKWFAQKLMVIYRADAIRVSEKIEGMDKSAIFVETATNEAAKAFGINSNSIGYAKKEDEKEARLYSMFKESGDKGKAIPAEVFESYGTIRFVNLFPLVMRAIDTGGTLVVDEFDASIHPMALMSIINVFHNDEINKKHAQLIFNTHNPIFLSASIFRRDEIKFVERDDVSQISELYSLADFKTSGANGVRKGEDYIDNYFVSKYGAIKDVDFTPIFEKIMDNEGAK